METKGPSETKIYFWYLWGDQVSISILSNQFTFSST